jgi:hypothetical protein
MAKSQWPVDGKPGKSWKVTSPFGYRVHPIKKTKKHHNGVDIWQGGATTYLEAWADGKVIAVYKSDNPNSQEAKLKSLLHRLDSVRKSLKSKTSANHLLVANSFKDSNLLPFQVSELGLLGVTVAANPPCSS